RTMACSTTAAARDPDHGQDRALAPCRCWSASGSFTQGRVSSGLRSAPSRSPYALRLTRARPATRVDGDLLHACPRGRPALPGAPAPRGGREPLAGTEPARAIRSRLPPSDATGLYIARQVEPPLRRGKAPPHH